MKIIILISILLQSVAIQAVHPNRELTTNGDTSTRNYGISHNSFDMNRAQYIKNIAGISNHSSFTPSHITSGTSAYTMLYEPHKCASWQVNDYWNAVVWAFGLKAPVDKNHYIPFGLRAYGYTNDSQILYIHDDNIIRVMNNVKLYDYDNFWHFISRFNLYEDTLQRILNDSTQRTLLSQKALQKMRQQCARITEKQLAKEREQRQRDHEKSVRTYFQKELPDTQDSVNEQQELHEIAHTYNLHNKNHYETRLAALEDVVSNSKYTHESYTLDDDVMSLLSQSECDSKQYKTNYGNQLQQVIHRECIDIIAQTAQLSAHSPLYDYKKSLVDFTDSARSYNQEGISGKAMQINNFCYALLDYGSAIVEGIACGVIGAAKDMINHPVQTALCVVAGEYVLAYQLLKVTTNLVSIGINCAFDKEAGSQQWHDYIEPITSVISAISNKELTLRDGVKGAVALGTGMYAQGKMLKGLNSFYKTTQAKALEFAKNNPLATPAEYMTTPEGGLFKAIKKAAHNQSAYNEKTSIKGFNGLANKISMKGLIKKKRLPTKGKIRYVPPKKLHVSEGLPRVPMPDGSEGIVDRFGNIWTQGESRTKGQPFEWDVQLSEQGKRQLGWMTRDNTHLNVSLDGRVTHK